MQYRHPGYAGATLVVAEYVLLFESVHAVIPGPVALVIISISTHFGAQKNTLAFQQKSYN